MSNGASKYKCVLLLLLLLLLTILGIINLDKNKLTLLAGDFNLDLIKFKNHAPTNDFITSLLSQSFFPAIDKPTRITHDSATLVDNIFVNSVKHKLTSGIIHNDISDHYPVCMRC